jgi:hypothetical protein
MHLRLLRLFLGFSAFAWGVSVVGVFVSWSAAADALQGLGAQPIAYDRMLDYWLRMAAGAFALVGPRPGLTEVVGIVTALSMSAQQLIDEAMALPLSDRVSLAQALWQSIGTGLAEADDIVALQDSVRRDQELSAGGVLGRTHAEVMQSARRAIGCA